MNQLIRVKNATAVFLVALACFGLSPVAQGQLNPPPDGGYPGQNTAEGDGSLFSLTFRTSNTALGFNALHNNTEGHFNTAIGARALFSNVEGGNTAIGSNALFSNFTGGSTAIGSNALFSNFTGFGNTAIGLSALFSNTIGVDNTAIGSQALLNNISGSFNTAMGAGALFFNTSGFNNTAIGVRALTSATANGNTATGANALLNDNTGANNTANGLNALFNNTTGDNNTANGSRALVNNTTGSHNIALGFNAGANLTTGDSNIDIGNAGGTGDAGTIRIGVQGTHTRAFVAGISGSPIIGTSVVVNSVGRLGTVASSQRFKDDIKPMDKASEAILALKPVTFRYKKEVDADCTPQFGLVAEDVEKINPDLVLRDSEGKIYSVRYEAVNAMLLNEFLKEHRKVAQLEKQIEALTAGLQKVSAQLEASKPAPRTVLNN
jgi:trimeric autotransporter adhesin